jgi:hypothetical protein
LRILEEALAVHTDELVEAVSSRVLKIVFPLMLGLLGKIRSSQTPHQPGKDQWQ